MNHIRQANCAEYEFYSLHLEIGCGWKAVDWEICRSQSTRAVNRPDRICTELHRTKRISLAVTHHIGELCRLSFISYVLGLFY
jgi:hypothetical protein